MIITTSASSLSRFQACELAHYYGKVKGLTPVERPVYLDRGTLIHALLEKHYKMIQAKVPIKDIVPQVSSEAGFLAVNKTQLAVADPEIIRECVEVYKRYAFFYANETWEIIAVEQPFSYLAYESPEDSVILEGRIDLVAKILSGEVLIIDHKSKTKQGFYSLLENQPRIYALISGSTTITINEVGFQKTPVFRRISLSYLQSQIDEFKEHILIPWAKRLLEKMKNPEQSNFLANPAACRFCDFKVLCETAEANRQWKSEQLFKVAENFDVYQDAE